jgi:hypothetical protein
MYRLRGFSWGVFVPAIMFTVYFKIMGVFVRAIMFTEYFSPAPNAAPSDGQFATVGK